MLDGSGESGHVGIVEAPVEPDYLAMSVGVLRRVSGGCSQGSYLDA